MNGKKKRTADRRNAGRRRSAHLHSYKKSVLMICTVLVFLSGVLAVGAVKLYAKNNAYKAQEEELAAQIKEEEKRSEEVKEYEKYVQTDEYIKETAEDKLGLVNPNEIILNRRIKIIRRKTNRAKKPDRHVRKITPGKISRSFFIDGGELKSGPVQDIDGCL